MITVTIVGAGRVGGALALALPRDRYRIDQIIGRARPVKGIALESVAPFYEIHELSHLDSDVVFITTSDDAIIDVAGKLAGKLKHGAIVLHTSGALPSAVLDGLTPSGCRTGSVHPLVSISRAELGPARFSDAFFCVEGVPDAVEVGTKIVKDLGGHPFTIETRFKTLYHAAAAAVMACGHLVALFDSAVEVLTKCGLTAEESKDVLLPLVFSTVKNLGQQSTSSALTGTFGRADIETFTRHLKSLNENVSDDILELYLLLGERSLELAAREGVSPERIDIIRTKMAVAKSRLKW